MQTKIITVFNQKGGSGKTTTATQLADIFGARGYATAVADIDGQHTASLLMGTPKARERVNTTVIPMRHFGKASYMPKLQELANGSELVFIDCPPILEDDLCYQSLIVADLVLIPVPPDMGDVISSLQAGEFAAKVRPQNPALKIAYVVSINRRGHYHKAAIDILKSRAADPVLNTTIAQRAIYAESRARNCGIFYLDPNAKHPASTELSDLADEVAAMLKISAQPAAKKSEK